MSINAKVWTGSLSLLPLLTRVRGKLAMWLSGGEPLDGWLDSVREAARQRNSVFLAFDLLAFFASVEFIYSVFAPVFAVLGIQVVGLCELGSYGWSFVSLVGFVAGCAFLFGFHVHLMFWAGFCGVAFLDVARNRLGGVVVTLVVSFLLLLSWASLVSRTGVEISLEVLGWAPLQGHSESVGVAGLVWSSQWLLYWWRKSKAGPRTTKN